MIVSRIVHRLILSLFDIAYRTRACLPLILSAGCLLCEQHVRLDIHVGARVDLQQEGAQIAFEIEEVEELAENRAERA